MAKEIEAIERVTSPGDLPSRLEAAENATVDVEKRLAKTVSTITEHDSRVKHEQNTNDILFYFTERSTTGTSRGMGAMRKKVKRCRALARSDIEDSRNTSKC